MKQCKNCGAQIAENARFCTYCMTALQEKTEIKPIKVIGRWPRYSAIAFLLCLALTVAFFAIPFRSTNEELPGTPPGLSEVLNAVSDGETDSEQTALKETSTNRFPSDSNGLTESETNTNFPSDTLSEATDEIDDSDALKSNKSTNNHDEKETSNSTFNSSNQTEEKTEAVAQNPLFASGQGTPSDPYLIATAEQLNNVRYHLGDCFKLKTDIEFSAADFEEGGTFYNGGAGWEPIGETDEKPFSGTFDGNGFSIKNPYLNRVFSAKGRAGLFGSISGTVQNLKVENGNFSVSRSNVNSNALHLGGICGRVLKGAVVRECSFTGKLNGCHTTGGIAGASLGTIAFCRNFGTVYASGASAGGIVGYQFEGEVGNCQNEGRVAMESATAGAGGIVGAKIGGTATNCCNTGAVELQKGDVGGIIGSSFGASFNGDNITENCYNIGSVTGGANTSAGGIIGNFSSGIIQFCYNTGDITSDAVAGGIVGENNEGISEFCYYPDSISLGAGSGTDCGIKCTEEQLRNQSTFAEFDFDTVWMMESGSYPYPILRALQRAQ